MRGKLGLARLLLKYCSCSSNLNQIFRTRKMSNSVFVQKFNPATGQTEWQLQSEDYDYQQEVARAAFADMLHDEERNLKYNLALQKAINSMKSLGKTTHVLDIGTGTGLLAMMGAKANADTVTACETFQPMVKCASDVIAHNKHGDQIKIIPKRSTDICVGPNKDMAERANILVTEVFDTELIGEGAISTFNHANQHLLTEDSIVVPARGTIYAQLIECQTALHWNRLQPLTVKNLIINPPGHSNSCPGNGAVHDIQLAQLAPSNFRKLSEPVAVFNFDWNSKTPIPNDDCQTIPIRSVASGTVHAVLMWWTLDMDREGDIVLSCAPPWAHPEGSLLPWRDHWMQAIYYLPSDVNIRREGEQLELRSYHDEYSLWFGLDESPSNTHANLSRPSCHCSIHLAVSRNRLGQLNDQDRNEKLISVLEKVVHDETVCLVLSDCSLLSLMIAQLGAKKVYVVEKNTHWRILLNNMIEQSGLKEKIHVTNKELKWNQQDLQINLLVGEPVFQSSILPWDNLFFGHRATHLRGMLAKDAVILPGKGTIYATVVEMKDLWKIRAPVGTTQGIDLCKFDQMIENAIDLSDAVVEPQPLWEYPCRALSNTVPLATLDLAKPISDQLSFTKGLIDIRGSGNCNGVALWMDWQFSEDVSLSGGPTRTVEPGNFVHWDINSKQGVYFLKEPVIVGEQFSGKQLQYQLQYVPDTAELKCNFSFV